MRWKFFMCIFDRLPSWQAVFFFTPVKKSGDIMYAIKADKLRVILFQPSSVTPAGSCPAEKSCRKERHSAAAGGKGGGILNVNDSEKDYCYNMYDGFVLTISISSAESLTVEKLARPIQIQYGGERIWFLERIDRNLSCPLKEQIEIGSRSLKEQRETGLVL
jgi:hypothetical protein